MATKKRRNARRGVSLGTATDGKATPTAPKRTEREDQIHPNIRRVMKLHHLDSPDVVFSIEDRSSAKRLSMASKIELWTQTVLGSLLVGVMDDPSLLTEAFKLSRLKQPPDPTIFINVLKQLA